MSVLIIASLDQQNALTEGRDWSNVNVVFAQDASTTFAPFDLILDLRPGVHSFYDTYKENQQYLEGKTLVKHSVINILNDDALFFGSLPSFHFLGVNAWPELLRRSHWEVAAFPNASTDAFFRFLAEIGVTPVPVADQVGLVTGRILAMIINEAFWMLQEGTATMSDIDNAMRLGVNYPYGPFEWAARIGIGTIYDLLVALGNEMGTDKVRIANTLRDAYTQLALQAPSASIE